MRTLVIFVAFVAFVSLTTVYGSERVTRQIGGGIRKLEGEELLSKQKELAQSLSLLATGEGPSYTIDKVYSGTTQVVAGTLDKLDVDLIDGKTGEKSRCIVSMLQEPGQSGYQLTFECKDKPTVVRIHNKTAENKRVTRQIGGGIRKLEGEELLSKQKELAQSLSLLATGEGPSYTIDKVYSGTTQVVAGTLDKLDVDLIDGKTGEKSRCIVSMLQEPGQSGYQLTFECKDKPTVVRIHNKTAENKRVTRQIGGGIRKLEGEELLSKQKELAQSLSLLATGEGPSYTIDKVYSGTTQVVAGTLDKLDVDLIDGKTGEKSRCIVSMLQEPGQSGYQLTFECKDKPTVVRIHNKTAENKRVTRQIGGGIRKLEGEELLSKQKELAQSLSLLATGEGPSYTIDRVYSGTTQVVAGTLDKLDVDLIDGKTGEKSRCIVSMLQEPGQSGYQLTFECKDKPTVVRQHS